MNANIINTFLAHPMTTSTVLARLVEHISTDEQALAVLSHDALTQDIFDAVASRLFGVDTSEKESVCEVTVPMPVISEPEADAECSDTEGGFLAAVQQHDDALRRARQSRSSAELADLALSEHMDVRVAALRNSFARLTVLREFAVSAEPAIREAVAKNARCPQDVLAALINDEAGRVRRAAVQHPKMTADALMAAVTGSDADLRFYAVEHPNADEVVLERLAALGDDPNIVEKARLRLAA